MVAAAESVNVVDFAPIAGHVAARVRAAAIFGPDVVPTPVRCHNGIWAGVSGSLIGSPGHLAGTCTCSVGQPRAWRTIDRCALPSMTCPPSHLLSIERGLTGITVTQSASLDGLLDERLAHRRRAGENAAVEVCRRGPVPWPNSGPGSPEALAAWSVSGREIESATLSRVTAKPPLPVRTTLGGRSSPSQRGSRKVKR
jgi:hypothetical protein